MKNILKKFLLITVLLFAVFVCKAESVERTVSLEYISETYIELFSTKTCLKPELVATWHTEAAKYVGEDKANDAVKQLVNSCQSTSTCNKVMSAYADGKVFKFCCSFLNGVNRITLKRNEVYSVDKQAKKLFSHKCHFVEKDSEGSYVFESNDGNNDEFRSLWMHPDSPARY